MKKVLAISLGILLFSGSSLAQQQPVPSKCGGEGNYAWCTFDALQNQPFQTYSYFYCTVDPKTVSTVTMVNSNVLISGFNGDGTLNFGENGAYPVSLLNSLYFEVLNDPSHSQSDPKQVLIETSGIPGNNIVCTDGQGGRNQILGGFGLKPIQ